MRLTAPLLLVGLALMAACDRREAAHTGIEAGAVIPAIDALFERWDKPGSPGCAVAVSKDGELIYSRGYGHANLDYDIPMTPQTVVDVASVNKQFVAAMLNMLALEARLSLDDDIREWLPELPDLGEAITLRHMIYHTSGLRDYLTLFPLAGRDHYYPISHAQILDMMSRQRALNFRPGERYEYSNTAYMLLAQVIERASGQSLGDFADQRIFGPLGMEGSLMYDNYEEIIPRRATGYDRRTESDIRMVHNFNFDVPGDGQLYSTVEDLLRWDNYIHGEDKPAFYASMLTEGMLNNREPLSRAQGLFLDEYRGLSTIHHTGSSWGSRAVLMRFIEPRLAIAITCNDGFANTQRLAWRVADHYLADEFTEQLDAEEIQDDQASSTDAPAPLSLVEDQLAEFAGRFYSAELDATYRFSIVDGGLTVRIEQEQPLAVDPAAADRFVINFDEMAYSGVLRASLIFERDRRDKITGFRLNSGSERNIIFEKQE